MGKLPRRLDRRKPQIVSIPFAALLLPGSAPRILGCMLLFSEKSISSISRKKIMETCGISLLSVKRGINTLLQYGWIQRFGRSAYNLNSTGSKLYPSMVSEVIPLNGIKIDPLKVDKSSTLRTRVRDESLFIETQSASSTNGYHEPNPDELFGHG